MSTPKRKRLHVNVTLDEEAVRNVKLVMSKMYAEPSLDTRVSKNTAICHALKVAAEALAG